MIGLAVPARVTRTRPILHVPIARVETVKNGLFCRLPCRANRLHEITPGADLFSDRYSFKNCVSVFIQQILQVMSFFTTWTVIIVYLLCDVLLFTHFIPVDSVH